MKVITTLTLISRIFLSLSVFACCQLMFPQSGSTVTGISNHGQNKNQPYITAGDRAYLIGTQDGLFPDMGDHVKGEMGGLWVHPVKLIDGFWGTVADEATGEEITHSDAAEFINYPYGNQFRYSPILNGTEVQRFQFSPDGYPGIIVQYTFNNTTNVKQSLKFQFTVTTDLTPVWFSEKIGIKDGNDSVAWDDARRIFTAWDAENNGNTGHGDWFAVWGTGDSTKLKSVANPKVFQKTAGRVVTAAIQYDLILNANSDSTITFVIAGSSTDKAEAIDTYEYLCNHYADLLIKKKKHYNSILETARIEIPDQSLQEVYNWVRVNMEWSLRDVPGIGDGLGAGFMEYPWWFGTETYSLQAAMASGSFDLVKQTLRLLNKYSIKTNGNGRIVHEVTTNGVVSNPGNSQETAQFVMSVGKFVKWSGDIEFAKEMYPAIKSGINWLLHDMDMNNNMFPGGYGIMEVYGLNAELIDVAVYTQQALENIAYIAVTLDDTEEAKNYQELASQLKEKINNLFWDEAENSYCDFYGSRQQAIDAANGAITQINLKGEHLLTERDKEAIEYYQKLKAKFLEMPDTNKGWFTNKNWVITTPVETGIAPTEKAILLLDKIRKEHTGEYGPYLSAVEKQAMMTISTGVQAVSECSYGRIEEALWYMNKIVKTFNMRLPGSISEMMPDYGCFTIAWTSYGIVVPLIEHIFGINPDAVNKAVLFEPHLPKAWENISINSLLAGDNLLSFSRQKTGDGIEYKITSEKDGWNLILNLEDTPGAKYYLNGESVAFNPDGFRMTGKSNQLLVVLKEGN